MGLMIMSERELNQIEVLSQVMQHRMSAVTAANVLGLSRRQIHRLLKDSQTDGPAAIRHKAPVADPTTGSTQPCVSLL